MIRKEKGQTVVIGSLLLLGLAVGLIVYIQLSILPDINQRNELNSQDQALNSMTELRSGLQTSLSTGTPSSVVFSNTVSYPPQPAAPPDQSGQLNFESGEMSVRNAVIKTGETENRFGNTVDVVEPLDIDEDDNDESLDNIVTVFQYIPSYIELTGQDRILKMDNTKLYESNPNQNRIEHIDQSIINGRQINLVATNTEVDGIKQQGNIAISMNPYYKINGEVQGDGGDLIIETYTTEPSDEWEDLESNENVDSVTKSGDTLTIRLDQTPENAEYYDFSFVYLNLQVS